MFKVIQGGKNEKIKKIEEAKQIRKERFKALYFEYKSKDIKKAIFYGIKYLSKCLPKDETYEQLLEIFMEFEYVKMLVSLITFKDFMNLFPIEKDFDGAKFQCKDYYSTIEYLEDKKLENEIGNDSDGLFWSYYNTDVMNFGVMQALTVDRLRRFEGRLSLMEEFLEQEGLSDKVHTYTLHEKEGYMYDNTTGKTFKVKKPKKRKPSQFDVIK